MQGQTSYYRNSNMGQWRYYKLLDRGHEPQDGRLEDVPGDRVRPRPDQPFDRAKYAQWRCYWDFGGGMYTDLFVHQLTHLIQAMGVRFPRRVVGGGGLYLEYDGRDVPDVATVVADYDEGCQVIISATMCNDTQLARGHPRPHRHDRLRRERRRVPRHRPEHRGPPAPPGRETPARRHQE